LRILEDDLSYSLNALVLFDLIEADAAGGYPTCLV